MTLSSQSAHLIIGQVVAWLESLVADQLQVPDLPYVLTIAAVTLKGELGFLTMPAGKLWKSYSGEASSQMWSFKHFDSMEKNNIVCPCIQRFLQQSSGCSPPGCQGSVAFVDFFSPKKDNHEHCPSSVKSHPPFDKRGFPPWDKQQDWSHQRSAASKHQRNGGLKNDSAQGQTFHKRE